MQNIILSCAALYEEGCQAPTEALNDLYFLCRRAFDSLVEFSQKPHTYTLVTTLSAIGIVASVIGYPGLIPPLFITIALISQYYKNYNRELLEELEREKNTSRELREITGQLGILIANVQGVGINTSAILETISQSATALSTQIESSLLSREDLSSVAQAFNDMYEMTRQTHKMTAALYANAFPGEDFA
jgi:hypothetical protein